MKHIQREYSMERRLVSSMQLQAGPAGNGIQTWPFDTKKS
jgi:hypothetical protein